MQIEIRRVGIGAAWLIATAANAGVTFAAEPARTTTYMIALNSAPLVADAQQRVHAQGVRAAGEKQAMRASLASTTSMTYLRGLDTARNAVLDLAGRVAGRTLVPSQIYRFASNGMALELTEAEAAKLATLPGVAAVRKERIEHLHTDAGPQWIGADELWNGQVGGVAADKGEGVVIGVIDTGINPTHPSFAATGPDGYAIANPRGHFLGLCASGQAACNDKLIGIYDFSDEGSRGIDTAGHGSHVSGIAAGNAITATLHGMTANVSRPVSGVAPHANLIMYKACNSQPISGGDGTCKESWLLAAIDQATADGVDVINYSIGGGTVDPYVLLADKTSDAYAFYNARAAGIVIAVSAGNDGPSPNTLDEPGNAPWVIGVANASHNRRFVNSIGAFTGAAGAPPDLSGQSLTAGYGPASIVYAGNYGSAQCGKGATEGVSPTGASNPFAAGTFHGEIVVCDRGFYARVEKGYNVLAAGAGGMILANAVTDGESVVADDHFLPAVHLGYAEGQQLEQWLATSGTHGGAITAASASLANAFGDILDASSSRGPYGFGGGILKPDVTAPGQNILSAAPTGGGLAILTGTSMASPHVAGSAALLLGAHPDWNPSQVESALLGTALANSVRLQDGSSPASPLDAGTGRVQPALAANAGLYLAISATDYLAPTGSVIPDPIHHGDLRTVNRIGIEDEHCFQLCMFTRTVTDMSGGGTWQVTTSGQGGTKISVTPDQFTLAAGASQALNIAVDVSDPRLPGTWAGGRILLHKVAGGTSASDMAMTVAVHADAGTAPSFVEIPSLAPRGNAILPVGGLPALALATFSSTSLATPQTTQINLPLDPTPGDPYTLPGSGKQVLFFPHFHSDFPATPDGTTSQDGRVEIIEVDTSNAPGVTLYVGTDTNGDGIPQQSEQLCESNTAAGSAQPARCIVDLLNITAPVWAVVQVSAGQSGATYSITLNAAQPFSSAPTNYAGNNGGQVVTGPGHVPALQNFTLRLSWSLGYPNRYFGAVLIDGAAHLNGQSGMLPFAITRSAGGNDIVSPGTGSSVFAASPAQGSVFAGAIEGGETLKHMFVDVPEGVSSLSIMPGVTDSLSPQALGLYLARADFPAASASPAVADAPPASAASDTRTVIGAPSAQSIFNLPVTPGRWYFVLSNTGAQRTSYAIYYTLQYGATLPTIAPGAYYNPQRSGHGIFISQVAGQQGLDWYTYLEDGTPTWYQAQGASPDTSGGPAWTALLFRVNWDGTRVNSHVVVGDATLTPVSTSDLMFSWHLDGVAGSERFTRLGAGPCPTFNGVSTNFNGAWYAPTQSGYGMDVGALPDLQFTAFYFYDALGIARWGSGSATPFAASSTINLTQNHGFCPICDYVAVTTQPLGTLTVDYVSAGAGTYASELVLKNPLSGSWSINQATARLTGSPVCSP